MPRARVAIVALVALVACAGGAACGGTPDLGTALSVTDVLSGWYDNGIKNGQNHLLPSITFRLKNASARAIGGVQLTVSYWIEGADGESDSRLITGIGGTPIQPGQSTEPLTVRATVGYTLDQPRAELFTHSGFKDWTVRMFARRAGNIYALGEFKVERRIIPHMKDPGRP